MPPPDRESTQDTGEAAGKGAPRRRAERAQGNANKGSGRDGGGGNRGPTRARLEAMRKRAQQSEKTMRSLRADVAKLRESLEAAEEEAKKARGAATRAERRSKRRQAELERALQVAAQERDTGAELPVFFVTGRAKSGTSWLMRLLDAHPDVLCQGEGRIFGLDYKRPDILQLDSKTLQPSSLRRAIADSSYLRAWVERSVWTRDRDLEGELTGLTRVVANHFLATSATIAGKHIVGDKTPFIGKRTIPEIAEVYPSARVIHIIRDGRDVAVSAMHHLWERELDLAGGNDLTPGEAKMRDTYRADPAQYLAKGTSIFTPKRLTTTAHDWATNVAQAADDGPRLLGDNYAEVRYEDLLNEPRAELSRLLSFIGAPADEKLVADCVKDERFVRRTKGRKPGEEDSTHLLRMGVAGDWRRVFNETDKKRFKEAAGEALINLGYEQDLNW